jgi:hypothetical protein
VPTLVHDSVAEPVAKLVAVRTSIAAQGWRQDQISPWAVSLGSLDDRVIRLAMGRR